MPNPRRKCQKCGAIRETRADGTLRPHSNVWKYPPPGAPLCHGQPKEKR